MAAVLASLASDGGDVGLLAGLGGGGLGVGPGLGQVEQAVVVGVATEAGDWPSLSSVTATFASGSLPVLVTT